MDQIPANYHVGDLLSGYVTKITNFGAFVRLETPLDFDAADRQPVDLVFALLAPEDAGVEHLKALALVSRTLRDKAVCMKLRVNTDPATLHAILTETQSTQAA